MPSQTQSVVYRLVQECLNNIAKHSRATNVKIAVETADGLLQVSVEDNGIGFQVNQALTQPNSFGLSGMRERVALLGGLFRIESHLAEPKPAGRTTRRSRTPVLAGGTRIWDRAARSRGKDRGDGMTATTNRKRPRGE